MTLTRRGSGLVVATLTAGWLMAAATGACSAGKSSKFGDDDGSGGSTGNASGGAGGVVLTGSGGGFTGDPTTCEEAMQAKTYIGCDFWPTVTPNNVWSIFDYAVVVANTGDNVVDVTVDRGGTPVASATIQPNSLQTVYLPWVPQLKGPDADAFGSAMPVSASALVADGAYHLVASYPVTVYQFNALEYAGQGGPAGKSWATCPGNSTIGCFSFSNDASLLLPSTAMTGNYRVTGTLGWPVANIGAYVAVTAISDGTVVNVNLASGAQIVGGSGVTATGPGGTQSLNMSSGQVALLVGSPNADFSGSLIAANKPVQVLHGVPCINIPESQSACDHIEESVFPAETLGSHYFVTQPMGPNGSAVPHVVRIYGNFDGTTLSYPSGAPAGAPTSINAGQVVDLGTVSQDFEVSGDQSFAVGSFMLGASVVDPVTPPPDQKGDPAQSLATAVEQYRDKYVFLAPVDYDVNYVVVILPNGATVNIDGAPITGATTPVGAGFSVSRVTLGPGNGGAHLLEASSPVGIQVMGYGSYTSYYYPGGLDLKAIAPPPVK